MIRKQIGTRIQEIRIKKCLSVEQLSMKTNLKENTIQAIERGRFSASLEILQTIAEALDCDVDFVEKH